jgi:hypothetical protein
LFPLQVCGTIQREANERMLAEGEQNIIHGNYIFCSHKLTTDRS